MSGILLASTRRSVLAGLRSPALSLLPLGTATRAIRPNPVTTSFQVPTRTNTTVAEYRKEIRSRLDSLDKSLLRELPFDDYIKLQKRHKIASYAVAIPSFGVAVTLSSMYMAEKLPEFMGDTPEQVTQIMSLDPIVFASIASTVLGLAGAFAGSFLYRQLYAIIFSKHAKALRTRQMDFGYRIVLHRRGGSAFRHDYYGDKIKSVSDYRKWLRAQKQIEKQTIEVAEASNL
eukprot:m.40523 g.40523  ORF g.40523 m.40523 type:complete len:231 (-) comp10444_c0_seq1:1879-2571(-)